jgi:hypothetical protein
MTQSGSAWINAPEFKVSEVISLKGHPAFNESWVEQVICQSPQILGLGPLSLVSKQKRQKDGIGRLDLVLEDPGEQIVYVVELMLGPLDPSHIVRTVEYWLKYKPPKNREDWEKRAVLIAEDVVASRFEKVVRFLSEKMPLMVQQLAAIKVGGQMTLHVTTLFDQVEDDSEDNVSSSLQSRDTWTSRIGEKNIALLDKLFAMLQQQKSDIQPNYKQGIVGLLVGSKPESFIRFAGTKEFIRVSALVKQVSEWNQRFQQAGFQLLGSGKKQDRVRFRLTTDLFNSHESLLSDFVSAAYLNWAAE